MFEKLFSRAATIAAYRSASLLEERLRYLSHSEQCGAPRYTLRAIATNQLNLVAILNLTADRQISRDEIEWAAQQWAKPRPHRRGRAASKKAIAAFVNHATRWMSFIGWLDQPEKPGPVRHFEIGIYERWMRRERALSEHTIRGNIGVISRFFDCLDARSTDLRSVDANTLEAILTDRLNRRQCSPATRHQDASCLMSFVRFAERRNWCARGIAEAISLPRYRREETIPKGLNRDEALRLLATADGDSPADVRDRAILMLLITYGLRSGEVCGLRLEDIHWQKDMLQVRCPKPGRTSLYPLSPGAGHAIARYLREVRFAGLHRVVFLTLKVPVRPLNGSSMHALVARRMKAAGINAKRSGPHALRHCAAQFLLDRGFSLKQIGDYLGHRSVEATSIYAKVDFNSLRKVVDIDLEGLI